MRAVSIHLVVAAVLLTGSVATPAAGAASGPASCEGSIFYPTEDASIVMNQPDRNTGGQSGVAVVNRYGSSVHDDRFEYDALIKFDLSTLLPGTSVRSATLHLYYYRWKDNNPAARSLTAHRLLQDWDELSVTWRNQPRHAEETSSVAIVPRSFSWMTWDMTSDVQSFLEGETTNYGWIIIDEKRWGKFDIPRTYLYSKERGELVPYLCIETGGLPMAAFDVQRARLSFAAPGSDRLSLAISFELHEQSDGIDPETEGCTVSIGSYTQVLPAESFDCRGAECVYVGEGPGITRAVIGDRVMAFKGEGIDLAGTANPVEVTVEIGNDIGETDVRLQGNLALPNGFVISGPSRTTQHQGGQ